MMMQIHYWITGTADGKPFLYYGGTSEKEATEKGFGLVDCFFEIKPLPTRDSGKAGQLLRGQEVEETGQMSQALTKRFKHTPM